MTMRLPSKTGFFGSQELYNLSPTSPTLRQRPLPLRQLLVLLRYFEHFAAIRFGKPVAGVDIGVVFLEVQEHPGEFSGSLQSHAKDMSDKYSRRESFGFRPLLGLGARR